MNGRDEVEGDSQGKEKGNIPGDGWAAIPFEDREDEAIIF